MRASVTVADNDRDRDTSQDPGNLIPNMGLDKIRTEQAGGCIPRLYSYLHHNQNRPVYKGSKQLSIVQVLKARQDGRPSMQPTEDIHGFINILLTSEKYLMIEI